MNNKNVIYIGLVSLFMQLGATFVFSTGNVIIASTLMPISTLILIRSLAESLPILLKLFSGVISDIIPNKKAFLFLGYGGIIICKLAMLFSTFTDIFSISLLSKVYIVALFIDRILNSIRDIPREMLIIQSSNNLQTSFSLRKIIGSFGSIIGGILSFVLLSYAFTGKQIYAFAILPLCIANIILYFLVKEVKYENVLYKKSNIFPLLIHIVLSNIMIYLLPISGVILGSYNKSSIKSLFFILISGGLFILSFYFTGMKYLAGFIAFHMTFFMNKLVESDLFTQIKTNISNKNFIHIGILSILLSFGRINETIYYTYGVQIGFDIKMTTLFFTFYYLCIIVGSLLFIPKKISIFTYLCIITLCLLSSNLILVYFTSKIMFFLSLFFIGIYSAGVELVLQLLISRFTIAKGTMFGYFYSINGFCTVINAMIMHKLLSYGMINAAKFACISPVILLIYIFIFRKKFA